ncbi:MAG: hypothetical protein MJZ68_04655 [archaeon]|nr:hypothetical protein [archaeon]
MNKILRFNFVHQGKHENLQVAAEKSTGKLILRCTGFFGKESEIPDFSWDYIMDEGDWEKLIMAIEDAEALKWNVQYNDALAEDATEWSIEIHRLGKHTISEGYGKFPATYGQLYEDMLSFVKMKRRQVVPDPERLNYFAFVEQNGEKCPMFFADNNEKTLTFYGFTDDYNKDGSFFMNDSDWKEIHDIIDRFDLYSIYSELPAPCPGEKQDLQASVSLGYKPGRLVQRYVGYYPGFWEALSKEVRAFAEKIYSEGRKPADDNIGGL